MSRGRPRTVCAHGDEDRTPSGYCRPCRNARQRRARAKRRAVAQAAGTYNARDLVAQRVGMNCLECGRHLVREHGVTEFCIDPSVVQPVGGVGHVPFKVLYDERVAVDVVSKRPHFKIGAMNT